MLVGVSHLIDIPSLDMLKAVIKADKDIVAESLFCPEEEEQEQEEEE